MIGQDHIRRLTEVVPGAAVVEVTDVDRERAAAAAKRPEARVFDDAATLMASDDVEAIVVASWGPAHEGAILPALAAGKPVFCEKPLATTQEACLRIIDAEVNVGRQLIQGGNLRDPIFAVMDMRGGALATVEVSVNIGYGYDIRGGSPVSRELRR